MPENRKLPHVPFTEEMKKDYTILIPNMLPVQFKLVTAIMANYGYHMEVLETEGPNIAECGLKNVHNDTCYPALLVIGQFIDALESGKYDTHKVALMITQTGGGCRASNYIHLLRKALIKSGFGYIPVISVNFSGLEKDANPGFKLTPKALIQVAYGVLLGDFISATMMTELSIVGGALIVMSGLSILKVKDFKTLDFLPALAVPVAWCLLAPLLGI